MRTSGRASSSGSTCRSCSAEASRQEALAASAASTPCWARSPFAAPSEHEQGDADPDAQERDTEPQRDVLVHAGAVRRHARRRLARKRRGAPNRRDQAHDRVPCQDSPNTDNRDEGPGQAQDLTGDGFAEVGLLGYRPGGQEQVQAQLHAAARDPVDVEVHKDWR